MSFYTDVTDSWDTATARRAVHQVLESATRKLEETVMDLSGRAAEADTAYEDYLSGRPHQEHPKWYLGVAIRDLVSNAEAAVLMQRRVQLVRYVREILEEPTPNVNRLRSAVGKLELFDTRYGFEIPKTGSEPPAGRWGAVS